MGSGVRCCRLRRGGVAVVHTEESRGAWMSWFNIAAIAFGAIVAFGVLAVWSCCVVSSRCDDAKGGG